MWDDGSIRFEGDEDVVGEWLFGSTLRYGAVVPECSHIHGLRPANIDKFSVLVGKADQIRRDAFINGASMWDKARWESLAAPHAGAWLDAPPCRGLDFLLTNEEVRTRVGRRLGCELCNEGPCPFCLGVMDKSGVHAGRCMGGGDKTFAHHSVRNDIYVHAKIGSTGPVLEAAGVLSTLGFEGEGRVTANRERPADVLLCRSQDIKVGRCRGGFMGRVALDVGIICSQAASHLEAAAAEVCGAAEEYARTKCSRADMERRCGEVGVLF